jgi:virginiamycin B lyase
MAERTKASSSGGSRAFFGAKRAAISGMVVLIVVGLASAAVATDIRTGSAPEFFDRSNSDAVAFVSGADGALWYTESGYDWVGRIDPTSQVVAHFPIVGPATGIAGDNGNSDITAGLDGNVWFSEPTRDRIARITPRGVITEFALDPDHNPEAITAGPDGNVWFVDNTHQRSQITIGRIAPDGVITEFTRTLRPTDCCGDPGAVDITAGADGNLWFTESEYDRIGRITPNGTFTDFTTRDIGAVNGIVAGPDGNVWFTDTSGVYPDNSHGGIHRITPDGKIVNYRSGLSGYPQDITRGPDGNLWFSLWDDSRGNHIGRITPQGKITEYRLRCQKCELDGNIATGPDHNLWFTINGCLARWKPPAT